MTYYHLPKTNSLSKRIISFFDEQKAARKQWVSLMEEFGATDCCGWSFFFKDNKKPNKDWVKSKKQKRDKVAYTPSDKTVEGKKMVSKLQNMPEIIGGGIMLMLDLFGDDPNVVIKDENYYNNQVFDFVRDYGSIGFKVKNGEVYMEGSDFWLFGEKEGAKEISNIEYRNLP